MPTAGWGLSLSAYEMARIGLMVLNNGLYNNTRIVVAITANFKPMVFDRVEYIEKNIVEALTER